MAFGPNSEERKSWIINWKKTGLSEELLYKEGTERITIQVRTIFD
jgi:hypothetical protein